MRIPIIALAIALASNACPELAAQTRAAALVDAAHARLTANDLDSAEVLLHAALDSATQADDSATALAWTGVLAFMRADEPATRLAFAQALRLGVSLNVEGLTRASPRLAQLYEEERQALAVYISTNLDEKPRRLSGPPVVYPPDVLRRQVRGRAMVGLIIDTLGHADSSSIEILVTPDSDLNAPLRRMILASTFTPGRINGRAVRTLSQLAIDLVPGTPPNATTLVGAARVKLAQLQADSAIALLQDALDSATHPTAGERVYALLVQGLAWTALGRDTLARAAFDTALAGYQSLTARGVELAPFLKRLADSVRIGRAGHMAGMLGNPTTVTAVDIAPALLSRPAVRYPPEMQALRVGGTVTVEATIDTTGHAIPASIRVIQSPNPGLDGEARRAVAAALYRPGRRGGHPILTVIHEAVTFVPY